MGKILDFKQRQSTKKADDYLFNAYSGPDWQVTQFLAEESTGTPRVLVFYSIGNHYTPDISDFTDFLNATGFEVLGYPLDINLSRDSKSFEIVSDKVNYLIPHFEAIAADRIVAEKFSIAAIAAKEKVPYDSFEVFEFFDIETSGYILKVKGDPSGIAQMLWQESKEDG